MGRSREGKRNPSPGNPARRIDLAGRLFAPFRVSRLLMKTQSPQFWKLFKAKASSLKLKSPEPEGLFEELADLMVASEQVTEADRPAAIAALAERERLASTGVGQNIAIQNVQLAGLERVAVGISIHPEGIHWRAIDGEPVHIFVTVMRPPAGTPEHDPEQHIEMMRWLARLARHEDFRRFAIAAGTRTELVQLLKEMADV